MNKRKGLLVVFLLMIGFFLPVNQSATAGSLIVAQDQLTGYNRSLFKHWIDADKDDCNTRAEVLIEEAVIKPKISNRCTLTGGKWLSPYDNKTTTKASALDIDHMVPLAEAWRSGAWAWTPAQRQAYANDLDESRALVAVSLGQNRSKSDRDVADWLPPKGVCLYVENWIAIKVKYSLSADPKEIIVLNNLVTTCGPAELTPASTPATPVLPSSDTATSVSQVTPAPMNPRLVKYVNCTAVRAAGVAPIKKSTDPNLYALNSNLDRDKNGIAC